MTILTTITYDNPSNYIFDANLIEVAGSVAKLKSLVKAHFTQPFDSDAGFTYNSTFAEFTGGVVRQKDLQPADSDSWATYFDSIDLDFGAGTLTGTPTGGAAVSGNVLDLKGLSVKYVTYDLTSNTTATQKGAVKFKIRPNYSGSPSVGIGFFAIGEGVTAVNRVQVYHSVTGTLIWLVYNNAGGVICDSNYAWSPVAGAWYEMELNFDVTSGETRMFINGTQHGFTNLGTGTRGLGDTMVVGSNITGASSSDYEFKDLVLFNDVQHTAPYTAGYNLWNKKYKESSVVLPLFTYTGFDDIRSWTVFNASGSFPFGLILNGLYWSGTAWVSSDGSYAQSTTWPVVQTNITTLPPANTLAITVTFTDSATQANANVLNIYYDYPIYKTTGPTIKTTSAVLADTLESFSEISTKPAGSDIKYTLEWNGLEYYFDGIDWIVGGGYVNAMSVAFINANIASFNALSGGAVKWIAYLSSDGDANPLLDSNTFSYGFYTYNPALPNKCALFMFLQDIVSVIPPDALCRLELKTFSPIYYPNFITHPSVITIDSANGYIEEEFYETETVSRKYLFKLFYPSTDDNQDEKSYTLGWAEVPDLIAFNIANLTFTETE